MKKLALFLFLSLFGWVPHAHATTCGNTASQTTNLSSGWNAGYQMAGANCTPATNVSVTDCKLYIVAKGSSGSYLCAIWENNGSGGAPGTLICQSSTLTSVSTGYQTFTGFGTCDLTAGDTYYVGWWEKSDASFEPGSSNDSSGLVNYYQEETTAVANFTTTTEFGYNLCIYLDVTTLASIKTPPMVPLR